MPGRMVFISWYGIGVDGGAGLVMRDGVRLVRRGRQAGWSCGRRVVLVPMSRHVDATADPDPVVALDVVEEARERAGTRGTPRNARVQPDRHQAGLVLALQV